MGRWARKARVHRRSRKRYGAERESNCRITIFWDISSSCLESRVFGNFALFSWSDPLPANRPAFRLDLLRIYCWTVSAIKFGTDGWRGVIADDFTFANVRKVACAIARYVVRAEKPNAGVLVGYDTRYASERFARAAAEVVSMAGMPVWIAEKACPSPALSLLVRQRGAAGGIMITASHNPYRWNGVKFKASYGSSALPSIVAQIEKELETVLRDAVPPLPPRNDLIGSLDVRAPYLETIEKLVDWDRLRSAGLRFVVDPMHGSARGLLCELMTRHGVRIGAMDSDGTFITPHQIFSLLLWHLGGTRQLAGDVAKTFSATKMVDKIAQKFGRKVFETPIGFKYICELMLERDILLGGEESGGIGTKLYLPERDATVMALLLAELMAWHRKSLGELVAQLHAEFGEHHYGRVDLELKPGQKERAIEHFSSVKVKRVLEWPVARREDLDGIKLYLGEIGWVMLRASGTEPMLRIYSETTSPTITRTILRETCAIVNRL